MSMTFPVGGNSGDFKSLESGSYAAVCDIVASLGVQAGSVAYPDPKRKVYIRFQVASERTDDDRPMVIGATLTGSMNKKAVLRNMVEGWRGKAMTDEEAEAFDISKLLGQSAMISVVAAERDGKTRSNIQSVSRLPKGMQAPAIEGEPVIYFNTNSAADKASFEKLPKWIQEKIGQQLKQEPAAPPSRPADAFKDDEEIPF